MSRFAQRLASALGYVVATGFAIIALSTLAIMVIGSLRLLWWVIQ